MTIPEIQTQLKNGTTAATLAEAALQTIKEKDGDVQAFLEVYDDVMEQAKRADQMLKEGKGGPLTGVPIALKDNILFNGKQVSAASKILEGYRATYDATVVEKLKVQGAVLVGRTNCDEFAMGSSTENSAYQKTKNPHDLSRVPGGSSGGSAAAVASGMVPVALGSDTGGSIRQPASFCGVVGLKPTYGSVSRNGLIAMGSSLDVIGSFTESVADAKSVFEVIKGQDRMDATTIPDRHYQDVPEKKNLFVGVPRDFIKEGLDDSVAKAFEESLEKLAKEGHEIVDVELPYVKHSLAVYYVIMPAEASTNLERFDGVKYGLHVDGNNLLDDYVKSREAGFGKEVQRRILLGTYVLSAGYYDAYYGKATQVREVIRNDFKQAFGHVDVIATPTSPTPPFQFGEKEDPLSMYLADVFTVPANIAGIPGISIPMGTHEEGGKQLPLGIQFVADHLKEETLFRIGAQFEAIR